MPFEVVHRNGWFVDGQGQRLGERRSRPAARRTSRAARVGDRIDVIERAFGPAQRLAQQRHDPPDMVAGSQFRDDAAVLGMHRDLGMESVRQKPGFAVVERNTGFVAGGFDTKDQHGAHFNT